MNIHLCVITPEKILLEEEVDEITAPTTDGEISILPNHVPLLTQVASGELKIRKGTIERFLAVAGGFLEVSRNKVTLLADYAIRSEDIELSKAEEAKKRAEKLMSEKTSERDFADAEAIFQRAILELKIGTKRRHHSRPPTS